MRWPLLRRGCPAQTKRDKIWLYRDKATGMLKGDGTLAYEDIFTAASAIEWFNGKEWNGARHPLFACLAGSRMGAPSRAPSGGGARASQPSFLSAGRPRQGTEPVRWGPCCHRPSPRGTLHAPTP
jgi:hypothetical protein